VNENSIVAMLHYRRPDGREFRALHPGASTLTTLARFGARTYRTDRCGALSLDVAAGIATSMLPCRARD
jgi:hypothetical protein